MKTFSFNKVIDRLNNFWQKNGCVILQPSDHEMGAATFHQATFINAINRKNIKAAYTQISKRPFDIQHNKNSNKSVFFHQYQVIIKPSIKNIQDLYINSLKNIGIDILKNDIKFIEDNWSSPSLGATGIGWEVRLNGVEITQFTYFQQMGGLECQPIMVEIAYGIERLILHIQKINNINEIIVDNNNPKNIIKYSDIFKNYGEEYAKYISKHVDIKKLNEEFDNTEKNIIKLLDDDLILIGYDHLIKLSHIFNLIDAKNNYTFTRQEYISRLKSLSEKIAKNIRKNDE